MERRPTEKKSWNGEEMNNNKTVTEFSSFFTIGLYNFIFIAAYSVLQVHE